MLTVAEIYDDAKRILGTCTDEFLFRRISQAIEALANSGQWDSVTGYADICVQDCYVTLPREIETILGLNINGHPSVGRDTLFTFHLNGPGDDWGHVCRYEWLDRGDVVTFRDLICPGKLVASVQYAADANSEFWVYGYDKLNQKLRSQDADGNWVDGIQIPTLYGALSVTPDAVEVSRITRIRKAVTRGQVQLRTLDASSTTGTLLGVYENDETDPIYRRIRLSQPCAWVRIAYRKRTSKVTSLHDHIPLHSSYALLLMLRAMKGYDEGDLARAVGYEANAVRFLQNEDFTRNSPNTESPIQVDNRTWDNEEDVN